MTGTLSSDEDDYLSDSSDKDQHPKQIQRKLGNNPIPARLRQSRQGRNRAKVGPPTKVHGRIHLSEYSMSASSGKGTVPAYSLMVCSKVPARSVSHTMTPTTMLLDMGALVSLMPLWQAKSLNVEVRPRSDIVIRGVDGKNWRWKGLARFGSATRWPPIGRKSRWSSHRMGRGP